MPLNDARTHTVLSALGRLEAEPEEKNRVVGDGGDGPNGEVKAAVSDASEPETEAETVAETENATETEATAAANGSGSSNGRSGRDAAEADISADSTVPISAVMAAAVSSTSAARTMPMPRIGGSGSGSNGIGSTASPTMRIPRASAEDSTRTMPIPNLAAEPADVIGNAVRDAAAEAMTMQMPAILDGAPFVETPTEPLPVLREESDESDAATDADPSDADDSPAEGSAAAADVATDSAAAADRAADAGRVDRTEETEAPTVSFRRMTSTDLVLPQTAAEVVAVVDAASKAIAAAEDAARQVAEAHAKPPVENPPPVLDLRQPAQPAAVDGLLDLLAPILNRPLLEVEQPTVPPPADLLALHRPEFELEFTEPPYVAAGDEPPIPTRFGPGLAVLPHIEFPV